jgi:hypothetical protein
VHVPLQGHGPSLDDSLSELLDSLDESELLELLELLELSELLDSLDESELLELLPQSNQLLTYLVPDFSSAVGTSRSPGTGSQ